MSKRQPTLAIPTGEIRAIPVRGIREVFAGDSVADLVVEALALGGLRFHDGDILVVKHKIVAKAEDRKVALGSVQPSAAARKFAADNHLDPSLVDAGRAEHIKKLLQNALKTLEKSRQT